MGKSETALLRHEMARMMAEIKMLQDTSARMKDVYDSKVTALEEQIDLLMERIAEQGRRLAKYENPNAPPSTNSIYNRERDAFRKRLVGEEGQSTKEGDDGPEPKEGAAGRSRGLRRGTREYPMATGPQGACAYTGARTAGAHTSRTRPL